MSDGYEDFDELWDDDGVAYDHPVPILGAGSHGIDVAALVRGQGGEVEFYDDDPRLGYPPCSEAPDDGFLIGVYDPTVRAHLDRRTEHGYFSVCEAAWVDDSVLSQGGLVVAGGAVLGNGVTLGRHVHVGQLASLVRCTVGDYTTVSPGAVICGDVTIGVGVLIGAGAVVSNLCEIGDGATVGAGAVLPPRTVVPAGEVWVGNPARALVAS